MIVGVVSVQGLPTIILPIAGRDWPATIDTGFNGDLELPDALRAPLNAQFVGRATAALAGGQSVEEDLYLVDFPFDGRIVEAEATFVSGSRILIGTHLLREYSLQIDFVSRTVRLERAWDPDGKLLLTWTKFLKGRRRERRHEKKTPRLCSLHHALCA